MSATIKKVYPTLLYLIFLIVLSSCSILPTTKTPISDIPDQDGSFFTDLIKSLTPEPSNTTEPTPLPAEIPCEIIYAAGWQGEGIYAIDMKKGEIVEIAKTSLLNNRYLAWNEVRNELYVVADNGGVIPVLETEPLNEITTIRDNVGWNAYSMEVSEDGKTIYITFGTHGDNDNFRRIIVLDPAIKRSIYVVPLDDTRGGSFLRLSPDGDRLYVSWDSNLEIFNTIDMTLIQRYPNLTTESGRVIVTNDNRYVYVVQPREILKWEIHNQQIVAQIPLPTTSHGYHWVELSHDGNTIWVAGDDRIYQIDVPSDEVDVIPSLDNQYPISIRESSNGAVLYVSFANNKVAAIDLNTKEIIASVEAENATDLMVRACDLTGEEQLSTTFATQEPTGFDLPYEYCRAGPLSRLQVGMKAYVSRDHPKANSVRKKPGINQTFLGRLEPGDSMEIILGPECKNGYTWWYVEEIGSSLSGWTAEGDKTRYWLVPCSGTSCP